MRAWAYGIDSSAWRQRRRPTSRPTHCVSGSLTASCGVSMYVWKCSKLVLPCIPVRTLTRWRARVAGETRSDSLRLRGSHSKLRYLHPSPKTVSFTLQTCPHPHPLARLRSAGPAGRSSHSSSASSAAFLAAFLFTLSS